MWLEASKGASQSSGERKLDPQTADRVTPTVDRNSSDGRGVQAVRRGLQQPNSGDSLLSYPGDSPPASLQTFHCFLKPIWTTGIQSFCFLAIFYNLR